MSTPQEVIKKFMSSLDSTTLTREDALDEAVKACSNYSGIQDVINNLISDCRAASDVTTFLKDKCDIILDNEDTGAITGSDAGGSTVKTAESVVPESGSSSYPSGTSFTIRGLTVNVPAKNTLTTDQQTVVQGLYSWWIEESLKLIEESYGLSFTENGTTVKEITLTFENKPSSSTLAYVSSGFSASYETNFLYQADQLTLTVNMGRFTDLSTDDVNGTSSSTSLYLDRTLAHELTHAIMAANINNDSYFPPFVSEGLAELVHGIDDERADLITYLVENPDKLTSYLRLDVNMTGDAGEYAAGYLLFRYLAKQASDGTSSGGTTDTTSGGSTETETSTTSTVTSAAQNIDNWDYNTTITTGAGDDTIRNSVEYVTINAGDGDNIISNFSTFYLSNYTNDPYVLINSGAGDDSIYNTGSYVEFSTGAGNDTIYTSGRNTTINAGTGDDIITLDKESSYIFLASGVNNLIKYATGDGADTIYGYGTSDTIQITSGTVNSTTQSGTDLVIKVGSGSITLKDAATTSLNLIDGSGNIITLGSAAADTTSTTGGRYFTNRNDNTLVSGTSYNDTFYNYGSNVTMLGFEGADMIVSFSEGSNVTMIGGAGSDSLQTWSDYSFLDGGVGADSLYAGGDYSTIIGGEGNDTIVTYGHYATISGGAGNDSIRVTNIGDESTVNAGVGNDTITLDSISYNNVIQYDSGDGNDIIYGYNATDTIQITSGEYTTTKSGDDLIIKVGTGAMTLVGAATENLNIVGAGGATETTSGDVTYNKAKTIATVNADFSGTLSSSDYAETVKRLDGSQTTEGVWLEGNDLNNSVIGGSGDDTLTGGGGTDKLYGGDGTDVFIYRDGDGKDTIYDYEEGERIIVEGKVDSIKASGSNTVIYVGSGRLTLKNTKTKAITWSDSEDKSGEQNYAQGIMYFDDESSDTGKAKTGIYTLDASRRTTAIKLTGNSKANTIIGGEGNNKINGGAGADSLIGGAGNDSLYGGAGNDTLYGGSGNDTLKGGGGADTFIYSEGNDTITDYTARDELIFNTAINSVTISKKNVIFNTDNGTLTVKNGKGKAVTLTDVNGTKSTQKYNTSSYEATEATEPWFAKDDNFVTDDSTDNLTIPLNVETYSIGKVESLNLTDLDINDLSKISYAKDDEK